MACSDPVEGKSELESDAPVVISLEIGSVRNIAKQDACDDDFDDSLDDIILSERRKMLLSRLSVTSSDTFVEASRSEMCGTSTTIIMQPSPASPSRSAGAEIKSESSVFYDYKQEDDTKPSVLSSHSGFSQQISNLNHESLTVSGLPAPLKVKVEHLDPDELDTLPLSSRTRLGPSRTTTNLGSHESQKHLDIKTIDSLEPSSASSFIENTLENGQMNMASSPKAVLAFPSPFGVKIEPIEENKSGTKQPCFHNILAIKPKSELYDEDLEDELDHMPLIDRIKLLSSKTSSVTHFSKLNVDFKSDNTSEIPLALNAPKSVEPISFAYPRQQRKTAIDSPQKALEEDAPELWKVLVENGLSTDEMKLYGEPESDEIIDNALGEDSFADLEAVILKVFAQHPPLFKLGSKHRSGITKTSYYVGCLLSLVEQAHYLRSRKWPVEWGWSRDLRAFIFVFQHHNRIVLERPEYGFATYFFEMLDSFSIGWQIRRLVIAMRLTNGGRVTMLENKPLKIGEHISEGEARVLEQYGWVPNTGLGTMLNYSDRVVHDIKNERNGAEWRLKIRNLLIKGFKSGVTVPSFLQVKNEEVEHDLLKDVEDDDFMDITQVKMELM